MPPVTPPSPLPPWRLRLAGNAFAALAALTPLVCATLAFVLWWSLRTPALSRSDLPLKFYEPFYHTGVGLFALCGVGGVCFTLGGIALQSHRLVLQGLSGLGVCAALWVAWGALMAYCALQFASD